MKTFRFFVLSSDGVIAEFESADAIQSFETKTPIRWWENLDDFALWHRQNEVVS